MLHGLHAHVLDGGGVGDGRQKSFEAIPTIYKGYEFRSRLEARWAVFFDAMKLTWEYEREGYKLDTEWYLPDFWLKDWNIWVEIKPRLFQWQAARFHGNFYEYATSELMKPLVFSKRENVRIIIGNPWPGEHSWHMSARMLKESAAMPSDASTLLEAFEIVCNNHDNFEYILHKRGEILVCRNCRQAGPHFGHDLKGPIQQSPQEPWVKEYAAQLKLLPKDDEKVKQFARWYGCIDGCHWVRPMWAYNAARRARFEHGEIPPFDFHSRN